MNDVVGVGKGIAEGNISQQDRDRWRGAVALPLLNLPPPSQKEWPDDAR